PDPDDPGITHHLLHRKRRCKIFCHHSGSVSGNLPAACRPQRHGTCHPADRHPLCGHLQRPDHPPADPARFTWRAVQTHARSPAVHLQPGHLRAWRYRGAVPRHQGNRSPSVGGDAPVNYRKPAKTALILFGILFLLTGLVYPLIITGIAELAFPYQAHGSLVRDGRGVVTGSDLIGQNFTGPFYFEGRPSSTQGSPYNAALSGASNLGPSNPALLNEVNMTIRHLETLGLAGPWPGDLVTSSASGLDPHISLDAALLQVPAVAKARGM